MICEDPKDIETRQARPKCSIIFEILLAFAREHTQMIRQHSDWKTLLARPDLIGGAIETHEFKYGDPNGQVYAGRIRQAIDHGDAVEFVLAWSAVGVRKAHTWEASNYLSHRILKGSLTIGEHVTSIGGVLDYYTLIFFGSGSGLQARKVRYLPPAWERLRRLYPKMDFDMRLAIDVTEMMHIDRYSLTEAIAGALTIDHVLESISEV